jgi:hypothetical protein
MSIRIYSKELSWFSLEMAETNSLIVGRGFPCV